MDQKHIRQQAEALVEQVPVEWQQCAGECPSGEDLRQVLHELRVHQIELEMQNEELRRVQESLTEARKEYFEIYNFAPVAYLTLNRQGLIISINLRGAELLGRESHYLLNRPLLFHINSQYHGHFVEYLDEVFRCGERMQTELVLVTGNCSVTIDAVVAQTANQEQVCRVVMSNITHLRQVERLLRVEKEQLRVTLHAIVDGVIVADARGRIGLINPPALAMLKRTEGEIHHELLWSVLEIFDTETNEPCSALFQTLLTKGEANIPETALIYTDNGKSRWIMLSASPIKDGDTLLGAIVVFRDETEKRKQQAEVLRTQKLEALGTLAGGIAHDFNNLLAGFFSTIDLAKYHLTPEHRAYRSLATATHSLERASSLTTQLLTFAQGGEPLKEVLSLAAVVTDAAQFALHGSNVKLQVETAPDLYPVEADRGQIGQVISNLVINAQHAMPTGGTLFICLCNVERPTGSWVQIVVQDEGVGIAARYVEQIFEPYFTTKQTGSGLGLTTTHSIIQKHNGTIAVESELNRGTTFTIHLPALPQASVTDTIPPAHAHLSKTLLPVSILVVDDEEVVRTALGEALAALGYTVTLAADGEAALIEYQRACEMGSPYNIVITDLTIPGGKGGQAMTQAILQIYPHAKIIVSSGYATDSVMANYKRHGFVARIVKPYRLVDLQSTLERVLQGETQQLER